MSLPYFPMFPSDFEAKTSHLTLEEDGAYNRLLRLMWMSPGCSLPDDDKWIMRRMRVDAETYERIVRVIIDEFCVRKNGRVSNAKLTSIFEDSSAKHKRRVSAGSKGGKAKALKTNSSGPSNAKAKPKQPEPEPEPDIEDTKVSLSLVPTDDGPDELSQAIDLFKDAAKESGWPVPRVLTKARRSALSARLKECGGIDGWRVALEKAQASRHCCGGNSRGWVLNFDFITTQSSFAKLMEGNYDNRTDNGKGSGPQRQARTANPNAGVDQISFAARGRRTPTTDCF